MAFLLRYLLLVTLMLGLAGHGSALARGGAAHPDAAHVHHAMSEACEDGECPQPKHADSCCIVDHCLLGLAAEQMGSLPQFAPARPVAAAAVRALAEAQDNPERPPRLI